MKPAPKRRWFRYSLRTLFVLVTTLACWLGYETNWIRQRHEFLDRFQVQLGRKPVPRNYSRAAYDKRNLQIHEITGAPPPKPIRECVVLRLFCEPQIPQMDFSIEDTDDWIRNGGNFITDVQEPLMRLFPESQFRATFVQPTQP